MNESIILKMAQPYVKDSALTYDEFESIFSMLSLREQYAVSEVLFKNGINLIDEHIEAEALLLDIDGSEEGDSLSDEDFEILYDKSIFMDQSKTSSFDSLVLYHDIKQSNEILCALIQKGNRQAVQDLCVKNKRLVDKYVLAYEKRYGNHLDFEDLEQVGFLGLIAAAQKFDAQQGTSFSTYAVFWIKQHISREIMDNGYAIRIPVHMMERINKVIAAENQLLKEGLPFIDRISQIALESGLSEENVRECLTLRKNYLSYSSLDTPVGEDGDSYLGDFIIDEQNESVEAVVISKALREELTQILQTLENRERKIIELRFGWNGGRPKTLEELGAMYNVTRERIRQIEAQTIRKLRKPKWSKQLREFWED